MELKGTTAVITGSSGQIGTTIALALAHAGCNCMCHYNRNERVAKELAEQVEALGTKALAIQADLTRRGEIEDLFERAAKLGTPQVLVNAAAVFSRLPLPEVTFEEAQSVLKLNVSVPILTGRFFAEKIKAAFPTANSVVGKIINIADIGGIRPWPEYVLYCSSKAALIGATKALAKELAPAVCVNAVAPGIVNFPSDFDESQKKQQLSLIPAARIGRPKEVADAVIFLLKNDYITGQTLNVDGGRCI